MQFQKKFSMEFSVSENSLELYRVEPSTAFHRTSTSYKWLSLAFSWIRGPHGLKIEDGRFLKEVFLRVFYLQSQIQGVPLIQLNKGLVQLNKWGLKIEDWRFSGKVFEGLNNPSGPLFNWIRGLFNWRKGDWRLKIEDSQEKFLEESSIHGDPYSIE